MGGEFGHAMSCAGLARSLSARGHSIAFMFRELRQLAILPDTSGYDLYKAPVRMDQARLATPPGSLADILLGCGYDDPAWLEGALREWLRFFETWKPDLLVGDYAPTALLAARIAGLKRVTLGIAFAVPPPVSPLPPFRFDNPPPPEKLAASDAQVLENVNRALAALGAAPLRALYEQFRGDEDFLCTFPELDAYGNRPTTAYWGPRFRDEAGVSAHWPAGRGPRVLVYVKKELRQMDALFSLLAKPPLRVIAYMPEIDAAARKRLGGPQLLMSEKPVRYGPLLKDCDLFVSHAGAAAAGTVLYGVPQLMFPAHYEQFLTSLRIAQLGAGVAVLPAASADEVKTALAAVLNDRSYRDAARAYGKRYPAYSPAEQQRRIVQRIEDILRAPKNAGAVPA